MIDGAKLLLRYFEAFARMAFRDENDGQELGDEPYIPFVCRHLAKVKDEGARCVVNLPPRHLKTFLGSVCLPAWLLARNPAEKFLLISYSESLAHDTAYRVRAILQSPWYRKFFPRTRLAPDRTRVGDFATTAGGRVFAASVDGSVTGRGASVIIFDDPLNINDAGNLDQIAKVNQRFDNLIMPRLNNAKIGQMVVIGHRLHPSDLSGHILERGGWHHIALPFMAPHDQDYELGNGRIWHRKTGDLLRPDAFSEADINWLKTMVNPDFEALFQQYLGEGHSFRITRDQFASFSVEPNAPIVISVDPGHRAGPGHSYTVMQAWSPVGDDFLLLEQWRAQETVGEASRVLSLTVAKRQAAAILIEWSGYGQTLADNLRRRFPKLNVQLIPPDGRSKIERVLCHADVFQSGRIKLPQDARLREEYLSEFEQFPHGPFDDQVDATTLFLDFMQTSPTLRKPQKRCAGLLMNSRGGVTFANQLPRAGISPAHEVLGRRSRSGRIFPPRKD